MKALQLVLMPFDYPIAAVIHAMYGAILACIVGMILWDYSGYGAAIPVIGAAAALLLSILYKAIDETRNKEG